MLLRISAVTIVVLSVLGQQSDISARQAPPIKFYGLTSETCGTWTAEAPRRTSVKAQVQTWWVLGYVSGASTILATERNITVASTDSNGIEAWITKYCSEHPLVTIVAAAMTLVGELRARATK
jgi:hypothetical protein